MLGILHVLDRKEQNTDGPKEGTEPQHSKCTHRALPREKHYSGPRSHESHVKPRVMYDAPEVGLEIVYFTKSLEKERQGSKGKSVYNCSLVVWQIPGTPEVHFKRMCKAGKE